MQQAPEAMTLKVIAHIHTAFPTKFGIPRQSGLVEELRGEIVFTPEYRNPDALRGLEDFSHIWLVWQFSGAVRESWSPTVRPPRLGGNTRVGVFATRSPFRPNPLGLSSVKLEAIEQRPDVGPVLIVRGADLMDGTPITAEQNIECYIGVPAAWHADFALTCHGDSMSPTICNGDIVCIRCQPEVEQGEIAAVRVGEEATLKHFHRQGDAVMLLADNAAVCPPMFYAGEQLSELHIEGKAVGLCRGL